MTEPEWLSCPNAIDLVKQVWPNATERKNRLYLVAGCYRNVHLFFIPEESLPAVEVGERCADGEATDDEISRASYVAECPTFGYHFDRDLIQEVYGIGRVGPISRRLIEMGALDAERFAEGEWVIDEAVEARLLAAANLAELAVCGLSNPEGSRLFREMAAVDWPGRWLVDCVYGNPFRPTAFHPAWRTEVTTGLARTMYDAREFGNLPVLADALQEAGCELPAVLDHCRGAGPHVRGCWVVDLVLGKA